MPRGDWYVYVQFFFDDFNFVAKRRSRDEAERVAVILRDRIKRETECACLVRFQQISNAAARRNALDYQIETNLARGRQGDEEVQSLAAKWAADLDAADHDESKSASELAAPSPTDGAETPGQPSDQRPRDPEGADANGQLPGINPPGYPHRTEDGHWLIAAGAPPVAERYWSFFDPSASPPPPYQDRQTAVNGCGFLIEQAGSIESHWDNHLTEDWLAYISALEHAVQRAGHAVGSYAPLAGLQPTECEKVKRGVDAMSEGLWAYRRACSMICAAAGDKFPDTPDPGHDTLHEQRDAVAGKGDDKLADLLTRLLDGNPFRRGGASFAPLEEMKPPLWWLLGKERALTTGPPGEHPPKPLASGPATGPFPALSDRDCFDDLGWAVLGWRNGALPMYWSGGYYPGHLAREAQSPLQRCLVQLDSLGLDALARRLQSAYTDLRAHVDDLDSEYGKHPCPADASDSERIRDTTLWPAYDKAAGFVDLVEEIRNAAGPAAPPPTAIWSSRATTAFIAWWSTPTKPRS